jgi:glucokinase
MRENDPAAAISEFGLDGRDPAALRALDMFVAIYGAQAGNLALTTLPRGGVYVAGGIAPKIIAKLKSGDFVRAFNDKGRFSALMQTIPLKVIMNPKVGLLGALLVASRS